MDWYPSYVKRPCDYGTAEMFNLHGGFEYQPWYRNQLVFSTGCGLLCKGSDFSCGYCSSHGIDWKVENNNPVVGCPYRVDHCSLRNPLLDHAFGGGLGKLSQCDCHMVDLPYDYERSIDKACAMEAEVIQKKYKDFEARVHGHVCRWHMYYDDWTRTWSQQYDPLHCARVCLKIGETCDLRQVPISKKRGNVFYDVKITSVRRNNTIFDGQEEIKIKKGCRLFDTGKSMTICEEAVKRCQKEIYEQEQRRYMMQISIYGWKVEVMNIRAEQRESRDLMKDLADIRAGIEITHASDTLKAAKKAKSARRKKAREQRIAKLEQKIIETGIDHFPVNSIDYIHAHKWLGEERLAELEILHQQSEAEKEEIQQASLLDFI